MPSTLASNSRRSPMCRKAPGLEPVEPDESRHLVEALLQTAPGHVARRLGGVAVLHHLETGAPVTEGREQHLVVTLVRNPSAGMPASAGVMGVPAASVNL